MLDKHLKIGIIGGSYLQLPLVLKAKEMGLETHCFAWEEGAVCKMYADYFYPISIIEKDDILNVCQKIGINAIATIASDLAVLTVTYVAEKMGLIANKDEYAIDMTNKYEMRNCFKKAGIPSPYYIKVSESVDDNKDYTYPLIVKPTDRSGSLCVEKVEDYKSLINAVKRACDVSFSKEAIIEQYIEGREISVEGISFKGQHTLIQITDKVTTGAPYFVELEHHQPTSLPTSIQNKVKAIVLNALDALHIEYGASHSELKITDSGEIYMIEIGGRMGGDFIGSHLVPLSTGYDYLKGVILCALGKWETPDICVKSHSGIYFLSKESEFIKEYITNKLKYKEIICAEITSNTIQNIHCSGDRSGYLIYKSDTKWEPKQNLQ